MESKNIVHVDIGGTVFRTTRSTLTSVDGFFARLWSGSGWADAGEEVGIKANPLFVDRDPLTFPSILSYLRSGQVIFSSEDEAYLHKLAIEADFYLLTHLSAAIVDELARRKEPSKPSSILVSIPAEEAEAAFSKGWELVHQYVEIGERSVPLTHRPRDKMGRAWQPLWSEKMRSVRMWPLNRRWVHGACLCGEEAHAGVQTRVTTAGNGWPPC